MSKHIPRIYYNNNLDESNNLVLPNRWNNHLIKVFRMKVHDEVIIYNEQFGEWLCNITSVNKNNIVVSRQKLLRQYQGNIKVVLAFCLIKYDNVKLIIEKCTELGISDFYPLISDYTQYNKLNIDKLQIIAIQASEQSERLDVPKIHNISGITEFINNLSNDIKWYSAIERTQNNNTVLQNENVGFLVGPEGGFSDREKELLINKTNPISLSTNILRAETACISCSSLVSYSRLS